jgi:predicted transcriptional regulator
MDKISHIVELLGGVTKTAEASEKITPQMVANWRSRDSIPARHIPALINHAKRAGVELDYPDFFKQELSS